MEPAEIIGLCKTPLLNLFTALFLLLPIPQFHTPLSPPVILMCLGCILSFAFIQTLFACSIYLFIFIY